MENQSSNKTDIVIQHALQRAGLVPSSYVRDESHVLVVLASDVHPVLQIHLAAGRLEQISGMAVTVRNENELGPAELVKLKEVGVAVA